MADDSSLDLLEDYCATNDARFANMRALAMHTADQARGYPRLVKLRPYSTLPDYVDACSRHCADNKMEPSIEVGAAQRQLEQPGAVSVRAWANDDRSGCRPVLRCWCSMPLSRSVLDVRQSGRCCCCAALRCADVMLSCCVVHRGTLPLLCCASLAHHSCRSWSRRCHT